jgi:hypothetical protein
MKRSSLLISNTMVLIIACILIIRNIYFDISFYTTSYSLAVCAFIISSSQIIKILIKREDKNG